MISTVSEKTLHSIRWVLVLCWLGLIFSLFYDPITSTLTNPNHFWSPLRDNVLLGVDNPFRCVEVQRTCLALKPYPIATRVFWGMVIPTAIMILLVFGHETWRRICPLYFFSQIPRALKLKPLREIEKNQWLQKNHLYLQFGLFFLGLNGRILFLNAERFLLGLFLLLVLVSAAITVWVYGGRSWCHYVCPFGIVQMVFTGPRGLLGSKAHMTPPRSMTQSMCRTVDSTGNTQGACIRCKSPCIDIDSEKSYWEHLSHPGRRLVQYGYPGVAIGYFIYYRLYSGNYYYYYSGAWAHEPHPLQNLLKPGFYLSHTTIPLPKLIACPLTLGLSVLVSLFICTQFEKRYKAFLRRRNSSISSEQVQHRVFSLVTFIIFNGFFTYGGRPEINRLPIAIQFLFQAFVGVVSSLWLIRSWERDMETYTRESLGDKLQRQLKKLPINFTNLLGGRTIEQLKPDEVYVLAKTLPGATQQHRLNLYRDVLREALLAGHVNSVNSLQLLEQIRQQLEISANDHFEVLTELGRDSEISPLLYPAQVDPQHTVRTAVREGRSAIERTRLRHDKHH